MNKQTFTTNLGSVEGYVVSGRTIIPTRFTTEFDEKHLDAATDLTSYTMPNGMTADAYYENFKRDYMEVILAEAEGTGKIDFVVSGDIAAADSVTVPVPVKDGAVRTISVIFYDASNNVIETGTGTVDLTGVNLSGSTVSIGTTDASAPGTLVDAGGTIYSEVTATPNTLSGVDHYVVLIQQD